ncbi:excisionase [Amorphus orientalis]|uniref:Uncharacterized protein n=1 Tax=Amorphus orientalis TaxID=649198 RepID=A0AAE3VSF4_9HYPH|nr:excisionase [Amorphus orientalis]MDQ0317347.1 hypothetical protein [Amorphus orientalis]
MLTAEGAAADFGSASALNAANDNTDPDAPVRLADILPLAFPHGGMTVNGLRREARRGNLTLLRIAGKDFTTIAYIGEMMEKCRVAANQQDSGSVRPAKTVAPSGSSSTGADSTALVAAKAIVERLKQR